jgi:hypothetical protein
MGKYNIDFFLFYWLKHYKNSNIIAEDVESDQEEGNEDNVGGEVPLIPLQDPRLQPHGQLLWEK